MDRKYWYIKRADIFSEMSPEEMEWLAHRSVMCTFVKGAVIFLPDEPSDHAYLLKEGAIKIARLDENGRETILELIAPGEIFGEMSLLGEESRSTMAQAMVESLICSVRKADFAEFFKSHSELAFKLLKLVGFKRVEIESRLEELAYCSVPQRIASLLLRLAHKHGTHEGSDIRIRLRISHRDIAFLVGASRETVTEILNLFKAKKVVQTSFMTIIICDLKELESIKSGKIIKFA